MVASGVVWCLKDDQWIPLQLNAIRLHGVLTRAHWTALAEFLQRVANRELVLQENGFTEMTEQQREVLEKQQQQQNKEVVWQEMIERERTPDGEKAGGGEMITREFDEVVKKPPERKLSEQNDEIVLRLLRKYCKYSRDALDDEIVSAIDACVTVCGGDGINTDGIREEKKKKKEKDVENEEQEADDEVVEKESTVAATSRRRKVGYCPKEDEFYENNLSAAAADTERVLRWLRQQRNAVTLPARRHSSIESSGIEKKFHVESRKSSVTLPLTPTATVRSRRYGRKDSVVSTTSSCSECEENSGNGGGGVVSHWQKLLGRHLGSKSEKRVRKQREAWARSTRKLSGSTITDDQNLQLHHP